MSEQELRDRLLRLEVIVGVGEDRRGLMAELECLRAAVEDLKAFQLRALGGFGVLAIIAQVVVQYAIRHFS